ncbi:hypothetical protein PtrSN002B_006752 [Pyrenophora tritici-repentis]|uniref:TT-ORF1 domain containing protein n=2 Tax=Pyrenophora tritici-repentis TaxID=45151 RepID=A0A2W1FRJ5_9PLEO|nr:uncharacterized protein PTRG_05552 [Pyrenophora tritici-repentis Pt-1C-BFP]KAF7570903.1 TT-ORF1 domain containing protein [Pyrenophora tritici-repentis]EDU48472.1 predicted protein [Pyrenophora tritici-repentis Pt-1C-BFP]KAI0573956.1 hypothetical protein Alg215_08887 [Pyrenophora tritici-repentis]KAI0577912.1 hypothetical protein Alg130_08159 [Pyrenophora tritici-repentis]KAI0607539.1 hypothetical protein TUN205_08207 [Pyrenophora tritici-repentis]
MANQDLSRHVQAHCAVIYSHMISLNLVQDTILVNDHELLNPSAWVKTTPPHAIEKAIALRKAQEKTLRRDSGQQFAEAKRLEAEWWKAKKLAGEKEWQLLKPKLLKKWTVKRRAQAGQKTQPQPQSDPEQATEASGSSAFLQGFMATIGDITKGRETPFR